FLAEPAPAAGSDGDRRTVLLDIDDVAGNRGIETRLHGRLTIPEERAAAALEAMSRFAIDPRWLIYLPPTMAPTGTSPRPGLLEHPAEAFDDFRRAGIPTVICEEKHMGSRRVVIGCRTAAVAAAGRAARARGSPPGRGVAVASLPAAEPRRHRDALAFVAAYRPYCWPVASIADVRFASFQILAAEGATYLEREHAWHMDIASRLAEAAPDLIAPTRHVGVDITDQQSIAAAVEWWEDVTRTGEGMVVKPSPPIVRSGHRLA